MGNNQLPEKDKARVVTARPLQRISWKQKTENDNQWFKDVADFYIGSRGWGPRTSADSRRTEDLAMLYDVYNGRFPTAWFKHVTDPLNAKDPKNARYPAKIRPTGMLRTNIDLLLGEYIARPLPYQVVNLGEDAFNSFLEERSKAIQNNLQEHFLMIAQEAMAEAGFKSENQIPQEPQVELPESVAARFKMSYKDNQATRGQRMMKRLIKEHRVRHKNLQMMKDWLITGEAYSYKNLEFGNLVYEDVMPDEIAYEKSYGTPLIEDGEWVIRRTWHSVSEIVDQYYDELKESDHKYLEGNNGQSTPANFMMYLGNSVVARPGQAAGQIAKYHVQWRGRKKILTVSYPDPLTGEMQSDTFDEDMPILEGMTVTKTEWVEEVYESTRLGNNIHVRNRAVPVQRNQMNNSSACKLSYNGKRFSDRGSDNISVLKLGLPYAIGYMIADFVLEKTIAKNKGKIALIDMNTIPRNNGWDDEKFFYYADAMGYMLINRSQQGVDKSWNQYQVLDMSLFDQIKELIGLRDSFSLNWDAILGINPQRKAQVGPREGKGTMENAVNLSATMTEMIFNTFDDLIESDFNGILDYSKFVNLSGVRSLYNLDDYDASMVEFSDSYASAELGLFADATGTEMQTLNNYKMQVQAMIQNGVKQSTILEIMASNSTSELMGKLKRLEEIEMEAAQNAQQDEHEKAMELEQIRQQYESFRSQLKINEINAEWDRKDQNEVIKAEYVLAGAGDQDHDGVPDAAEINNRIVQQQQMLADERGKLMEMGQNQSQHNDKMALEREKLASTERIAKDKNKVDRIKARKAGASKKK